MQEVVVHNSNNQEIKRQNVLIYRYTTRVYESRELHLLLSFQKWDNFFVNLVMCRLNDKNPGTSMQSSLGHSIDFGIIKGLVPNGCFFKPCFYLRIATLFYMMLVISYCNNVIIIINVRFSNLTIWLYLFWNQFNDTYHNVDFDVKNTYIGRSLG